MQSSSRNGAKVIWLGVHTTEGIMRATDLRDWTSWAGSSHASNDETGVLLSGAGDGFVDYDRAAWTLRNGNPISDNLEQCGWARWTRAEWLARPKLLDTTARWLADRHRARPWIPLERLSLADIKAKRPGVIGHGDYTNATGDGTHTDPGPNYPWDVVLDKARAYAAGITPDDEEIDMSAKDELWDAIVPRLDEMRTELDSIIARLPAIDATHVGVMDPEAGVRNIVLGLAGRKPETVDIKQLAAAVAPLVSANPGGLSDEDLQRIAKSVADEQAKRQAD